MGALYIEHLDLLKLKVRKFADHEIYEFDSLEELREFDRSYMEHSGSDNTAKHSRYPALLRKGYYPYYSGA